MEVRKIKAVAYSRVSSKAQEKEGFSIIDVIDVIILN